MYYVIQIDHSEPFFGSLVGPFCCVECAQQWAEQNIRNGEWNISPLHNGSKLEMHA